MYLLSVLGFNYLDSASFLLTDAICMSMLVLRLSTPGTGPATEPSGCYRCSSGSCLSIAPGACARTWSAADVGVSIFL